jgi:DNA modification methylase
MFNIFPKNNIYYSNKKGILYNSDTLTCLKQFPDASIDCVVTSPPYWALRDYQDERQLGLEPTPKEYLSKLLQIFDEVYRILKPTGTCWVNLGDTYAGSGKGAGGFSEKSTLGSFSSENVKYRRLSKESWNFSKKPKINENIKSKSLCLIPERFAIGMIERGWILRNQIIWNKPNAMPSSAKDRFTVDFEKIFFFTKNKKYYFKQQLESYSEKRKPHIDKINDSSKIKEYMNKNLMSKRKEINFYTQGGRNKRTVWQINTKPFKDSHFAVFPPEIPETCIKAGCPEGGIVLDPFMGSGTTAIVSAELGCNWIGIELNPEYCDIIIKRIKQNCNGIFF